MFNILLVCLGMLIVGIALFYLMLRSRNIDIWIASYVRGLLKSQDTKIDGPKHILFCFADHYEPQWRSPSRDVEDARVQLWVDRYPKMAEQHLDADGVHPQHSFFYPEEEYRPEHLTKISQLCEQGFGEIEVHLHHDNDTEAGFRSKLEGFVKTLHDDHGAFGLNKTTGKPSWAFIHGNWTLCNSAGDGANCGVNAEIPILLELDCYCDMTLPSSPSDAQTSTINEIYYAKDQPGKPKSHNTGRRASVGVPSNEDEFMLIQGPLGLNWKSRKFGLIPRIENADVRKGMEPTPDRVDAWVDANIHVDGRPEWLFVKVHTHGTQERDADVLLGEQMSAMHSYLERRYNDGNDYVLHYVTAREMYNIAKAAEAGEVGNPNSHRDYLIAKPRNRGG